MKTQEVMATTIPHVSQVKVPLPYPLRWVNSYVIQGEDGWTVIDPGLHTQAAEELWQHAMDELRIGWRDIERIVLTHHHPDHYGLAGWMQERSGAKVWLSETGYCQAKMLWQDDCPLTDKIHSLFLRHGMDADTAQLMIPHLNGFISEVSPQPEVCFIPVNGPFALGAAVYQTIETAGHAAGHISFYDAQSGVIFCGDHVLPQISPNVSLVPGVDEDPLGSYLKGLDRLSRYSVSTAFPGHREPFEAFSQRCLDLIAHHERRIAIMLEQLETEPLTAWQLCQRLFGSRLTVHQQRFAMAETIAHLVYLTLNGALAGQNRQGTIVYSRL